MASTIPSANEALKNLRKFGGKSGHTSRTRTSSSAVGSQKQQLLDSEPIQKSLASGELDKKREAEDVRYENIKLSIEKNLISHIDQKIEQVKKSQSNWHNILLTIFIGVIVVGWLFWQGKIDSLTERLIKLETLFSVAQENNQPHPNSKERATKKQTDKK